MLERQRLIYKHPVRYSWRRPWTGISERNTDDQAAGRMVQGQRNRSLKRRRLVMCLRSL